MNGNTPAARARIALSLIGEPGDSDLGLLVNAYGPEATVAMIQQQRRPEIVAERTWATALARWLPRAGVLTHNDQLERATRARATLITPDDPRWPIPVDDLGPHAPLLLWVRGDAEALAPEASVAIVGARAATGYGEHVAADLAGALARTGGVIVSGGAYGIDGVAHRAALAVEGRTVAVMAGGVDRPYPAGHAALIAQIERAGAVISELPLGVTPSRWRFLARNRLITALTDATVVVEAGWRSGSLNTAGHAAALGRPLGAVPGPITSPASMGCHRLLREYDAVCITTPDEVRELAGWSTQSTYVPQPEERSSDPSSIETRILDALSKRVPRDIDAITRRVGCARQEVQSVLGHLTLTGLAASTPEGYILTEGEDHG